MKKRNALFSKKMPQKFDVADGGNSFILGRKSFSKKTFKTSLPENLPKNLPTNSKTKSIPLINKSSSLRTQRLRLNAIGRGSTSIRDENDRITFKSVNENLVWREIQKTRGGPSTHVSTSTTEPESEFQILSNRIIIYRNKNSIEFSLPKKEDYKGDYRLDNDNNYGIFNLYIYFDNDISMNDFEPLNGVESGKFDDNTIIYNNINPNQNLLLENNEYILNFSDGHNVPNITNIKFSDGTITHDREFKNSYTDISESSINPTLDTDYLFYNFGSLMVNYSNSYMEIKLPNNDNYYSNYRDNGIFNMYIDFTHDISYNIIGNINNVEPGKFSDNTIIYNNEDPNNNLLIADNTYKLNYDTSDISINYIKFSDHTIIKDKEIYVNKYIKSY